jgi:hypothetical protein
MSANTLNGHELLGTGLQQLLMCDSIVPGAQPSYQMCKEIYVSHPHGAKLVDFPIQMAQFKPRRVTVPRAPDDGVMLIKAFLDEWRAIQADRHIFNTARQARIYGVSTLGMLVKEQAPNEPVDFQKLHSQTISFNVWDPLNTAGSLVLNQDPNSLDFQKVPGVVVSGVSYHRTRACVLMNEDPLYIEYQSAGFGFLGRSVYQRGLVPLKSFVLTLATDMMIALKAGVLITKMESQSSAVDGPMSWLFGSKRSMVKEAQTGNVLSIGVTEDIESLNLQNLDGAYTLARKNIIENEAAACGTPAKIVLAETFAEGFGEGTEDAKAVAQFVETIRTWMQPLYSFMDQVVMYRAWNEEFYKTIQARYPEEYGNVSYTVAFQEWKNSFAAEWPNLLEEPDSEKAKAEDVKLKAIISVVEVLLPTVPQTVKARIIEWMQDNLNDNKRLFSSPMDLDFDEIANYEPVVPGQSNEDESDEPKPESLSDSELRRGRAGARREALDGVDASVRRNAMDALRLVRGQAVSGGEA